MITVRSGQPEDASQLSHLILSSAPVLLPYLFGDGKQALAFIKQAAQSPDGQYSAAQHQVVCDNDNVIACMALWHSSLSASFQYHTVQSLKQFLSNDTLLHLVRANSQITDVFIAPNDVEICVGHLAVKDEYQRQGIGKILIEHAISQAQSLEKTHVVLDVDASNKQALSFYADIGFVLVHSKLYNDTHQMFHRLAYHLR